MRELYLRPCDEPWESMHPTEQGRHCDRCDKTVVDLTGRTRREARALMEKSEGRFCGQLAVDSRGYAVFAPEPPPARRRLPVLGAAALAAQFGLAGCHDVELHEQPVLVREGPPMLPVAPKPAPVVAAQPEAAPCEAAAVAVAAPSVEEPATSAPVVAAPASRATHRTGRHTLPVTSNARRGRISIMRGDLEF